MLNDLRSLTFNLIVIMALCWLLMRGCDARLNAWRNWRHDQIDARKDRWDKWWEDRRKSWNDWRHRRHPMREDHHEQSTATDHWPTYAWNHDEQPATLGNHFICTWSWSIDRLGNCAVSVV